MRTIKQWFELVEDEDLRAELLEAMDKTDCDTEEDSFRNALHNSFVWADSIQGHAYWEKHFITTPKLKRLFS